MYLCCLTDNLKTLSITGYGSALGGHDGRTGRTDGRTGKEGSVGWWARLSALEEWTRRIGGRRAIGGSSDGRTDGCSREDDR